MEIFDSHAHYHDGRFDPDRDALLGEVLPAAGVIGVLEQGTTLESSRASIALAERYDYVWAAAGIHPEDAKDLPEDWLAQLTQLLSHPRVKALGEIGLDYHWLDACPKDRQQEVFAAQLALAKELDLPVVIHDREAHGDTLAYLQQFRPAGVLHCFSGSWEMARQALDLGLYLGFGGVVTFPNSKHAQEVVTKMPLDRLLLETDAPYMAPVPYRGRRNDSSLIRFVAEKIGELRGQDPELIASVAAENTRRLFSL